MKMDKTFRFRLAVKKPAFLWQGFKIFILICIQVLIIHPDLYAKATALSDEELDNVFAQGFSFDFDISFGDIKELMKNDLSQFRGIQSANNKEGVIVNDKSVKFINPDDIRQPLTPIDPEEIIGLYSLSNKEENGVKFTPALAGGLGDLSVSEKSAKIQELGVVPSGFLVDNATALSGNTDKQTGMILPVPLDPLSILPNPGATSSGLKGKDSLVGDAEIVSLPATGLSQPGDLVGFTESFNPGKTKGQVNTAGSSQTGQAQAGALEQVSNDIKINNASVGGGSQPSGSVNSPLLAMASQKSSPENSKLQLDISAGSNQNGKLHVDVGTPVSGAGVNVPVVEDLVQIPEQTPNYNYSTPNIMPNGGANIVVIDDLAQQHLASFVNVNAAGSIVPVLLNITININSTVDNLSNVNTVDLSNYYRFQINY